MLRGSLQRANNSTLTMDGFPNRLMNLCLVTYHPFRERSIAWIMAVFFTGIMMGIQCSCGMLFRRLAGRFTTLKIGRGAILTNKWQKMGRRVRVRSRRRDGRLQLRGRDDQP